MAEERYVFSATGHRNVEKAFRSIADAAEDAAKSAGKAGRAWDGVFSGRRAGAGGGGGRSERAPKRYLEQLALRVARDQERARKRELAAQKRHEAQKAREAQRAQQAAMRQAERQRQMERRRVERDEAKRVSMIRRHARSAVRAESRAAERLSSRRAEIRRSRAARRRDFASDMIAGTGRTLLGGALAVGSVGAAFGAAMIGRAAHESNDLQERSNRLAIAGGIDPRTGQQFDASTIRRSFERTALQVRGTKAGDVASGVEEFVTKTGRLDLAADFQKVFAQVAMATGASVESIGSAAADIFEKFDVTTVEDMNAALAALAVQGKKGAFELRDAASQFPKLAAAAQRLGIGKGVESVKTLGGLTQIARTATGSPEQAANSLEATFRQLTARSTQLRAQGVNVFDREGNARNIVDVLAETVTKVGGTNIERKKGGLQKIFGEEGIRAISPLISKYAETTGTAAERMQALKDMMNEAIDATGAEAEIKNDLAQAQQNNSAKLTAAWESMKAKMSDAVLPAIGEFASTMESMSSDLDIAATVKQLAEAFMTTIGALKEFGLMMGLLVGAETRDSRQLEEEVAQNRAAGTAAKFEVKGIEAQAIARAALSSKGPIDISTPEKRARIVEANLTDDEAAQRDEALKRLDQANAQNIIGREQLRLSKIVEEFSDYETNVMGKRTGRIVVDEERAAAAGFQPGEIDFMYEQIKGLDDVNASYAEAQQMLQQMQTYGLAAADALRQVSQSGGPMVFNGTGVFRP